MFNGDDLSPFAPRALPRFIILIHRNVGGSMRYHHAPLSFQYREANEDSVVTIANITNRDAPWSAQELTMLGHLFSIGFPIDHVANFLRRDLHEVTERISALPSELRQRKHHPGPNAPIRDAPITSELYKLQH